MAASLQHSVNEQGYWDADLVKVVQNLRDVVNELQTDHASIRASLSALRVADTTAVLTPPNFEIDTNFDVQNGDAFEIVIDGVSLTVATDINFDTGTATVIATNAYWACGLLSINVDGTTAYVDWGAEASSEALAKTALADVTASGSLVCGYFAAQAKGGQDLVAGTDALNGGSGGQVAQTTNYYNDVKVGATYVTAAAAIAAPAALTNSTAITLAA